LPVEDRQLAQTLLENGAWVAQHNNPVEEVERLDEVAKRLKDQMARTQDPRKVEELNTQFLRVSDQGIKAKVEQLKAGPLPEEDRRKLDEMESRNADRQKKTEDQHKPPPNPRDRVSDTHRQ